MKPVLISEHQNEALAFIREIESDYLPIVQSVRAAIQGLGLTPTEAMIRAVLTDGPKVLEGKYSSYAERDITPGSTQAVKAQMRSLHAHVFSEFVRDYEPLLERTIAGKAVKNPLFQALIVFDENLIPSLPEEGKAKIMAQFREYISDPRLLKLRNSCAEAATGLQSFWQALVKAGYASGFMIDYTGSDQPGWMIERQVLHVLSSFLTITGAEGQYNIEPRQMNFIDVQPEINDDHGNE
jgi:hypothetical protein